MSGFAPSQALKIALLLRFLLPQSVLKKTKLLVVKIISNLKKIISKII